jgi:hypothetical protein
MYFKDKDHKKQGSKHIYLIKFRIPLSVLHIERGQDHRFRKQDFLFCFEFEKESGYTYQNMANLFKRKHFKIWKYFVELQK